jgi:hypothetical protein
VSAPPLYFAVPAGTPPSRCRSCGAVVYWAVTPKAKRRIPVDCDVPGGAAPSRHAEGAEGRGYSHFATCPERDQWRSPLRAGARDAKGGGP